nr:BspA family leucine-rich repeat surface protein [uncultured Allomuricauda sp.]
MRINNLWITVFIMFAIVSCSEDDSNRKLNNVPKFVAQELVVKEDFPQGQIIGLLEASDPDNDPLTFTIFSNDNDIFELTDKGELSLAEGKTLDFETSEEHQITATVSDGSRQVDAKITILVENVIDTKSEELPSFVTTWETTGDNESITIGTHPAYNYNYAIDWGDGTVEEQLTAQNPTHVYEKAGIYTVIIQGEFPSIIMDYADDFSKKALKSLDKWGTTSWLTLEKAFKGCSYMLYNASDVPDLTSVTNLAYMFANTNAFNADLNSWDLNNISTIEGMFANTVSFDGNISSWNVANITNMSYLFNNAESFNGDLSTWNVAKVQKMNFMFNSATSFNSDISNWEVGNVTDMVAMFAGASSFNTDISSWNVENVESMYGMFTDAQAFNQNLGDWNIKSVTNLEAMLTNSGFSRNNYELTLIGWSELADELADNLTGITLGATNIKYCSEESISARNNLSDNYGWEFVGDVQNCN